MLKQEGGVPNVCSVVRNAHLTPEYVHHIPGRMRLQSDELKRKPTAIAQAAQRLVHVPGVSRVTTNEMIGSITLEYDVVAVHPGEILTQLKAAGIAVNPRANEPAPIISEALSATSQILIEKSLRTLLDVLLQRTLLAFLR
jgi:Heavy metal associated domain 2